MIEDLNELKECLKELPSDMEKEAYLEGNMLMRDFEDNFKYQQ